MYHGYSQTSQLSQCTCTNYKWNQEANGLVNPLCTSTEPLQKDIFQLHAGMNRNELQHVAFHLIFDIWRFPKSWCHPKIIIHFRWYFP